MSRLLRRLLDGGRPWSAPERRQCLAQLRLEAFEDRLLPSTTPLGEPFDVSGLTTGGQDADGERAVARADDGTFAVVWDGPGASGSGVHVRLFNSDGGAITSPILLPGTSSLSSQATVAANGSGSQFVVAWAHNGDIRAARFSKAGVQLGGVITVAASAQAESGPSVGVDDWGNFNVAYSAVVSAGNSDVFVRRFSKTGAAVGSAIRVGGTSAAESDPSIAVSPAGFTVVAWTTQTSAGNRDVHAQRLDYRGRLVGGRYTIAGGTADEAEASVAVDSKGNSVVAYTRTSGGNSDVLVHRYSTTAVFRGAVSVATTTAAETSPSVASSRDGQFSVAYVAASGVRVRSFDASGNARGDAVSAPAAGQQGTAPGLALDSKFMPVVVFEDATAKSGQGAVYARVFAGVSLGVTDASLDDSADTVFRDGAVRVNYRVDTAETLSSVIVTATQGSGTVTLGAWTQASLSNGLVNLASKGLTDGTWQITARVTLASGRTMQSSPVSLRVLSGETKSGTFRGETLAYSATSGQGAVFLGSGGTDTLDLGVARSAVASLNGLGLGTYNPLTNSTADQAIYRGSAYDFIRLGDGREVYFQGVERLRFSDGTFFELAAAANDPRFNSQWNLHVSDIPGAWRFSQGSGGVLLVSLDTGILTAAGAQGGIHDISISRLLTDPTDDDNFANYGHGHSSISVMAGTVGNASGVAGINAGSKVFVADVYNGVSLQKAIQDALAYARANGLKAVFQGGIQGEYWLTSGGTQAQLEALLSANEDIALFAIAAGNGNVEVNQTSGVDPIYSGGMARLQGNHGNVMSVGALQKTGTATVNGRTNASSVNRASYSNHGNGLTLMGATDVLVVDKFGQVASFYGTSAANPNVAAVGSLVWSVNAGLTANQVRQILTETAIDLGLAGRDTSFGHGLVNADAAVRRAVALGRAADLAGLYGTSAVASTPTDSGSGVSGPTAPPQATPANIQETAAVVPAPVGITPETPPASPLIGVADGSPGEATVPTAQAAGRSEDDAPITESAAPTPVPGTIETDGVARRTISQARDALLDPFDPAILDKVFGG